MARFDELEQDRLAAALARAQDACNGLGDDPSVRSRMQAFLHAVAPKLQLDRVHRGDKPPMRAARLDRRDDVDRRPDGDPLKASRKAAYDRLEELLEAGWPPLSRTESRHKARRLMHSTGARARPGGVLCGPFALTRRRFPLRRCADFVEVRPAACARTQADGAGRR